jgi:hypothetical protein
LLCYKTGGQAHPEIKHNNRRPQSRRGALILARFASGKYLENEFRHFRIVGHPRKNLGVSSDLSAILDNLKAVGNEWLIPVEVLSYLCIMLIHKPNPSLRQKRTF